VSATQRLEHAFIAQVPEDLENGRIYVSLEYRTVIHLCACGCGREVVTPLRPDKWRLTFDGESVSLWPSIGNWSFPCRSHYWIEGGSVRWAPTWSQADVAANRAALKRAPAGQIATHQPSHRTIGWLRRLLTRPLAH
jgi:hypothetical protein